jgi:PAS domain S-box-containing protein
VVAVSPLPLTHSWPLYEATLRLPLGNLVAALDDVQPPPFYPDPFAQMGIGIWQCDLKDNSLNWTAPVYELFGFPEGEPIERPLAASLYLPDTRIAMEELRAYAIRHRRGFTLDAQIRRPDGDVRWMRLSAIPVIEGRQVVRLCGTKQDVTQEYDGPSA